MKFTYFQVLGLVIFKSSYFNRLQANSKANYDKLAKENVELQNEKLLRKITTLQNIVKEERLLRKLSENDYAVLLEKSNRKIKAQNITIASNHFLIKDLWNLIQKLKFNITLKSLKKCKRDLTNCQDKIDNTLGYIETVKDIRTIQPANKEIVTSSKSNTVDTYA